ncbi:MAG: hypothetical protein V2A73_04985 [Pseudomonadota bacterium]
MKRYLCASSTGIAGSIGAVTALLLVAGAAPSALGAPDQRAISKAVSGLAYCHNKIPGVPAPEDWNRLHHSNRTQMLEEAAGIADQLKQAIALDPSITEYDGEWRQGQSYKQAFKTCTTEYLKKMEALEANSINGEALGQVRWAFIECDRAFAGSWNNKKILESFEKYRESRDAALKLDPRLRNHNDRYESWNVKETLAKCDAAYAAVEEEEKPGRIVVSRTPTWELETKDALPSLVGDEASYALVEIKNPEKYRTSGNVFLTYKIQGLAKAWKVVVGHRLTDANYKKTTGTRRLALLEVMPNPKSYQEQRTWQLPWELALLKPGRYTVAVSIVTDQERAIGSFVIDTTKNQKELKKLGYDIWAAEAAKNTPPKPAKHDPKLEQEFLVAAEASGLFSGKAERVLLMESDWRKTYHKVSGELILRSMYVVVVGRYDDSRCYYAEGAMTHDYTEGGELRASVNLGKPEKPILCSSIK